MIPNLAHVEHWKLLTPTNISARRLWGWGHSIQKIVAAGEPKPRESKQLLVASDYGGNHNKSTHLIYCYLVVRSGGDAWMSAVQAARQEHMRDRGAMSYKRLNDPVRQKALIPFLQAAAELDGHLVAIAVDKKKRWLSIQREVADDIPNAFQLKAYWNARALEAMFRKTHLLAILLSIWSQPYGNVTWITDEDEFVANDARHDDALHTAARLCSFYLPNPQGIFRLNTTGQDPESHNYEDLCSIPDLAAGMLSEISTHLAKVGPWEDRMQKIVYEKLLPKVDLLADWFWDADMTLRKTLIAIDVEDTTFSVRRVHMEAGDTAAHPVNHNK